MKCVEMDGLADGRRTRRVADRRQQADGRSDNVATGKLNGENKRNYLSCGGRQSLPFWSLFPLPLREIGVDLRGRVLLVCIQGKGR